MKRFIRNLLGLPSRDEADEVAKILDSASISIQLICDQLEKDRAEIEKLRNESGFSERKKLSLVDHDTEAS